MQNTDYVTGVFASIQHSIWAHWMRYQFSVSSQNNDGSVTIPAEQVERWRRQMDTDYHQLSEKEQKSDRDIVTEFLPQEVDMVAAQLQEQEE